LWPLWCVHLPWDSKSCFFHGIPLGPAAGANRPWSLSTADGIWWEYPMGIWWKLMEIDGNWWKLMEYVVVVVTWCKLRVVPVVPLPAAHLTRFLRGTTCNFCRATRRSKASQIGSWWADNWCVYLGATIHIFCDLPNAQWLLTIIMLFLLLDCLFLHFTYWSIYVFTFLYCASLSLYTYAQRGRQGDIQADGIAKAARHFNFQHSFIFQLFVLLLDLTRVA
jgi:hypothetical protein